jgi:hypothetical protein
MPKYSTRGECRYIEVWDISSSILFLGTSISRWKFLRPLDLSSIRSRILLEEGPVLPTR